MTPLLLVCALLLVAGLMVFAVGCGSAATTTTTSAQTTTTAAAPDTTAAGAATTVASGADTTAGGSSDPAAASGTIVVKGLVDNPTTLTVEGLQKMKVVTMTADHPKLGPTEYTGVKFSDILTLVGVQSAATVIDLGCTDGYMAEISVADLRATADAMLAIGKDGTLNAVMPGMFGKAWARDIITMEFK
jgi:DMSO/TMAO reductase YedYZ molybdopterin-dependent catalytic subunit